MSTALAAIHWFTNYSVVIMTLLFVTIFAFTYWPSRKASIEAQGQIPLKDDV
jgi:cbb3-type cytochrome oxidase subunit 3